MIILSLQEFLPKTKIFRFTKVKHENLLNTI